MKKTIIFIAGLLALTFIATACVSSTETPTETPTEQPETADTATEMPEATTLQEQLDIGTIVEAVNTENRELCDTVESAEQKDKCYTKVDDQIILNEAVEAVNKSKCKGIVEDNTKEKCEIYVQEKIDEQEEAAELEQYFAELDEELDADEKKLDEILKDQPFTAEACEVIENPDFKQDCIEAASFINAQ